MPRIVLEVGEGTDHVGFDHVFIKSTGWVKAYDDDDHSEHDHSEPVFYPPHRVRRVVGDATHNSSHGRV